MKARSRCSIYLPVAACGKNIAHDEKLQLQETSLAALTASQGEENWTEEQRDKLKSLHLIENQSESTMLYTKAKKEELERYQDCSWFQNKPSRANSISKLSQAEALISPDIEVNELDLGMQFANRDVPPWGDEYLEVFDDEDFHSRLEDKFGEKENHIYPSNENSAYINHKLGEDGISDLSIYNNYTIRKTDSYDNMKVITSTNLSEVIPISYHEQVNNMNYNLQCDKVKIEVKEELGLDSPDSDSYVMESEDGDFNIGREEVIEVEVHDSQGSDKLCLAKLSAVMQSEKPVEDVIADIGVVKVDAQEMQYVTSVGNGVQHKGQAENMKIENSESFYNTVIKKEDMKLDLRNTFEQSLNMPTPELDFMDLVEYINNEMSPVPAEPSSEVNVEQLPVTMPLKESSPNTVTPPPGPQDSGNTLGREPLTKPSPVRNIKGEVKREGFADLGTINVDEIVDSMSIAERIKTGTSRKRSSRYSLENVEPSEDEENKDDDYEYEYDVARKRCRSRSRNSESVSSYEDSYRERRDKNNEASRRSRQNKKDKERQMYKSREEAERRNAVLKAKADRLEKLVAYLRQMLLQLVQKKGSGT